jgi:DUF1680 family protein
MRHAAVLFCAAWIEASVLSSRAPAADDLNAVVSPTAPAGERNRHYASNREPLLESPLVKLPPRSIRPEGWLRRQLELLAEGMTGRLPEISPWCNVKTSAWANPRGEGTHPWEELPYWLKGFVSLGYALGDERILNEAKAWIDGALASQDTDGWFGPRENKKTPDIWPNMVLQNALQTYHEATGDPRVLPFLLKYSRWILELPREKLLPGSWQKIRGGDQLATTYWLYNRTGEPWLLDVAKKLHERTAPWEQDIASWHGVNITQSYREPAVYYQQSKDAGQLAAAERNYSKVMTLYGQVPGGMFGADENARQGYSGPRQGAETCSMVEYMLSFEMLLAITGDPKYADRCEDVAFNSLPASMTKDLKALHYLTAANMVQCDAANKAPAIENEGCMFAFSPDERYRCCQHNVSHGWPYFSENLWMATRGNGLAAVLYAPCEVEATVGDGVKVKITESTGYPFEDNFTFRLSLPKDARFPLAFRIPSWCEGAAAIQGGNFVNARPTPGSFLVIDATWKDGDAITLSLPMRIGVRRWKSNDDSVSIDRGPLTYALRIAERWQRIGGPDRWPNLELYAASPWNYGLVLDEAEPSRSFGVVKTSGPLADQPFDVDAAPIRLKAKARRIPQWKLDGTIVGNLQPSPVQSKEPIEEVTLIPMGCARLRIASFPVIGNGPGAHEWKEPPKAPAASHVHDDPFALNDGVLPKSSNDPSIPRFTWWDHKGTKEWVQYDFEKPRSIAKAAVYWFDDTGVGQCRVPKSWRLLRRSQGEWVPVAATAAYGVDADRMNQVTFSAVETDAVRLEVELKEGFSGGVLEWKVE